MPQSPMSFLSQIMRRPAPIAATLCAAFLLPAGCAQHHRDPIVQKQIQAAYDAQSRAYDRKDASGVLAICSPDYQDVNGNESDGMDKYAETIRGFVSMADTMDATATVSDADIAGDRADVTVHRHFDMSTVVMPKDGKHHQFVSDETNTDTWERDSVKGWLKLRSVTTRSSSTLDGKSAAEGDAS